MIRVLANSSRNRSRLASEDAVRAFVRSATGATRDEAQAASLHSATASSSSPRLASSSPRLASSSPRLAQGLEPCTPKAMPISSPVLFRCHQHTSARESPSLLTSPLRRGAILRSPSGSPADVTSHSAAASLHVAGSHVRHLASRAATPLPSHVARQIGERARQRQQTRLWSIVIGGTAVAGFTIAALNAFQENLMFYITPTQAVEKFAKEPTKSRFRLGGLVLEGSVKTFTNTTEMEFVVTDLETDILVRYRGALPDLFREGHSVVAEGFLKPMPEEGKSAWEDTSSTQSSTNSSQVNGNGSTNRSQVNGSSSKSTPSLRSVNQPSAGPAATKAVTASEAKAFPFKEQTSQIPDLARSQISQAEGQGREKVVGAEGLESGVEDVSRKARCIGVMFTAMEVLAKHDEKYMPKEVAAVIATNKAKQEAEEASDEASLVQPLMQSGPGSKPPGQENNNKGRKRSAAQTPTESQAYEVTTT